MKKINNIVEKPTHLENWTLGKTDTEYKSTYDRTLLVPILRSERRKGYTQMFGVDIWTAFEFSFLLPSGLPVFKVLRITNDCNSENIFESKSLKLYLNSFNNTVFDSLEKAISLIEQDLTAIANKQVSVEVIESFEQKRDFFVLENEYPNVTIENYNYDFSLLKTVNITKEEKESLINVSLESNLLRSNCEITNQPDWGRVQVHYEPNELLIDNESLLKYIVSYRNHQEFHEPTCERIFQDLLKVLNPLSLTVTCQYTRRGGIDINPIRTTNSFFNSEDYIKNLPKLIQQ